MALVRAAVPCGCIFCIQGSMRELFRTGHALCHIRTFPDMAFRHGWLTLEEQIEMKSLFWASLPMRRKHHEDSIAPRPG